MKTNLFNRLSRESDFDREWCGNDDKGKFTHHGAIPLAKDPVIIKLSWKSSSEAAPQYIGTFELFLSELLERGIIAQDKPNHVRVKFMNVYGLILLATAKKQPYLLLGLTKSHAQQR